jgi:hypothetical protein
LSASAFIQISTSSGVARITGIALGWNGAHLGFGFRRQKHHQIVGGLASLTFRADVQLV